MTDRTRRHRLGERGGVLHLVGEQHVGRVVDLVLRDVDLHARHLTDREAVRTVDRTPEAGVDPLVGETGDEDPGREGSCTWVRRTIGTDRSASRTASG